MMKKVQAKALHSYSMDDEKRYRLKPYTVTAWMMKKVQAKAPQHG